MRAIDDHISDEMAMGEMMLTESYPGGGISDKTSNLVDDLTDRVEVSATVCPRSSDPIIYSKLLYKNGIYFLDTQ